MEKEMLKMQYTDVVATPDGIPGETIGRETAKDQGNPGGNRRNKEAVFELVHEVGVENVPVVLEGGEENPLRREHKDF
jgi:hypothetical protein